MSGSQATVSNNMLRLSATCIRGSRGKNSTTVAAYPNRHKTRRTQLTNNKSHQSAANRKSTALRAATNGGPASEPERVSESAQANHLKLTTDVEDQPTNTEVEPEFIDLPPIGLPSESKTSTVFRPLIPTFGLRNLAGAPDRSEGVVYRYQGLRVPICEPKFSYIYAFANISVLGLLGLTGLLYGDAVQSELVLALANKHSAVWDGEYIRLLTSNWIFANPVDMTLNTIALLFVAPEVEAVFGYTRFNFIAFMVGLAGSSASLILDATSVTVGGRHMLYGLLGAYAVYCARHGPPKLRVVQLLFIALVFNYNLLGGDQLSLGVSALSGAFFAVGLGPLFGVTQGQYFNQLESSELSSSDLDELDEPWRRDDVTEDDPNFDPSAAFLLDRVSFLQMITTGVGFFGLLVAALLISSPTGTLSPGRLSDYWTDVFSLFQ